MKINTFKLTFQERIWLELLLKKSLAKVGLGEVELSQKDYEKFIIGQKKLNSDYPLDYLLGEVKFLDKTFKINESVLIPREETEHFVEYLLTKENLTSKLLVDIGTGSGIIGLCLASRFDNVICTDISSEALQVCKRNINSLGITNAIVIKSDLLSNPKLQELISKKSKWSLIANLPYLPQSERKDAFINKVFYEPDLALYSGLDGLDLFRKLLLQLGKSQLPSRVYFELDTSNVRKADKMVENLGYKTRIVPDAFGKSRFVIGQYKKDGL